MAWLELHQAIRDHRKVVLVADALDMPEPHVVGHLAYLWLWSLDNAPDGRLPSRRVIARAAWWTGDADAFVDALIAAGLIDADGDALHIHDWEEYAGKLLDRRASNRERQARHRHKTRTDAGHNGYVTVTSQSGHGATEQNSTEQNSTGEKDSLTRVQKAATPPKPRRKSRLASDWMPSETNTAYAAAQGLSDAEISRQAELFRDHWLANGETKDDWDATWRNWIRRAPQFDRPRASPGRPSRPNQFSELAKRLEAEERGVPHNVIEGVWKA